MRNVSLYTLHFDELQYKALKAALAKGTGVSLHDKLMETFQSLYKEYVSDEVREFIDTEIEQDELRLQAEREARRTFAVCHVRENGENRFFRCDAFQHTTSIAIQYRRYEQGELKNKFSSFADACLDIEPIEADEYAETCADISCDRRITAIWEFDLDSGTIITHDRGDTTWKKYRLQDFSAAARQAFENHRRASDSDREKIFRSCLARIEIPFDGLLVESPEMYKVESDAPVMQM